MSERQSRKRRQNVPESAQNANKKSPAQIWTNVGIGVVVAGFLVLAGFAVKPAVETMIQNYQASQPQEVETIEKYAKANDLTAEEFINEYGLAETEGITKDSALEEAKTKMSIANYAKFAGVDLEEFRTSHGLDDTVTNETTYTEAQPNMSAGAVAQDMGMDFATLSQMMGLPEGVVSESSKWSEVIGLMQMMQQASEEAQQQTVSTTEVEIPAEGDVSVSTDNAATTEEVPQGEGE